VTVYLHILYIIILRIYNINELFNTKRMQCTINAFMLYARVAGMYIVRACAGAGAAESLHAYIHT